MKKTLLACLVCALVFCVSAVNASVTVLEYKDGTLKDINGKWQIAGLWGTGTSNDPPPSEAVSDKWLITPDQDRFYLLAGPDGGTPEYGYGDMILPAYLLMTQTQGSLNGIFTITSSFIFEALTSDITGVIGIAFENFTADGTLTFLVNGERIKPEFTDDDKVEGILYLDLAKLAQVEDGVIAFGLELNNENTTNGGTISIGFAVTGVTSGDDTSPSTPEPATLAILGLGTLGAGFAARRRLAKK